MNKKEMESLLDHQDWKQVVVGKKKSKSHKKKNKNPDTNLLKLEKKAENDELKQEKITKELRTKI